MHSQLSCSAKHYFKKLASGPWRCVHHGTSWLGLGMDPRISLAPLKWLFHRHDRGERFCVNITVNDPVFFRKEYCFIEMKGKWESSRAKKKALLFYLIRERWKQCCYGVHKSFSLACFLFIQNYLTQSCTVRITGWEGEGTDKLIFFKQQHSKHNAV